MAIRSPAVGGSRRGGGAIEDSDAVLISVRHGVAELRQSDDVFWASFLLKATETHQPDALAHAYPTPSIDDQTEPARYDYPMRLATE